ncbi:hypothetical protein DUNSADRAFT_17907 [Dunaliella salina]|uniref:Uncharacterized protein n=1 Tax=Dunaliella salina TaxID=3046 RepID=A0ABQ7H8Z9_DUNSA|nr:hypothetical protein DUNSADRAFT_17907 [Dunaliella salina]|eukprot:KAF5843329.1 hypothetical protein DUNSADRAFT_17907 [Dunaliella salina]
MPQLQARPPLQPTFRKVLICTNVAPQVSFPALCFACIRAESAASSAIQKYNLLLVFFSCLYSCNFRYNPMFAGCATGGMMAYGAGPKAMCFGCISVGAFSAAIEHFLELH